MADDNASLRRRRDVEWIIANAGGGDDLELWGCVEEFGVCSHSGGEENTICIVDCLEHCLPRRQKINLFHVTKRTNLIFEIFFEVDDDIDFGFSSHSIPFVESVFELTFEAESMCAEVRCCLSLAFDDGYQSAGFSSEVASGIGTIVDAA